MTEGCGRLPTPAEMAAQLEEAGFLDVTRRSLIPGESFYSFVGANRARRSHDFSKNSRSRSANSRGFSSAMK